MNKILFINKNVDQITAKLLFGKMIKNKTYQVKKYKNMTFIQENSKDFDPKNKYIFIFCGHITNLKKLNQSFVHLDNSKVNTETIILMLIHKIGIRLTCQLLKGYFAFICYNCEKDILYATIDSFGIKSLYLGVYNKKISGISSEAKSLVDLSDQIIKLKPGYILKLDNMNCNIFNHPLNSSKISYFNYFKYKKLGDYIEFKSEIFNINNFFNILDNTFDQSYVSICNHLNFNYDNGIHDDTNSEPLNIGIILEGTISDEILIYNVSKMMVKNGFNKIKIHSFFLDDLNKTEYIKYLKNKYHFLEVYSVNMSIPAKENIDKILINIENNKIHNILYYSFINNVKTWAIQQKINIFYFPLGFKEVIIKNKKINSDDVDKVHYIKNISSLYYNEINVIIKIFSKTNILILFPFLDSQFFNFALNTKVLESDFQNLIRKYINLEINNKYITENNNCDFIDEYFINKRIDFLKQKITTDYPELMPMLNTNFKKIMNITNIM